MRDFKRFKTLPQQTKRRILGRYILFQVPDMAILILILIVVYHWVDLPPWFSWGFVSLGLLKDVLMFPFVWSAYEQPPSRGGQSLIDAEGIAEERLAPSGYIRVHGEMWQAEVMEEKMTIEKGGKVLVQDANGLTLIVRPMQRGSTGGGKESQVENELNGDAE
jgi:membrane-bound ClpP family serine protease